jgi:GT2 family glycosyltransferase
VLGRVVVDIVDNGYGPPQVDPTARVDRTLHEELSGRAGITWRLLRGHGNVGYGRGHNLSLAASRASYHLILNPDVRIEPEALREAIVFLEANTDVGLLAPEVRGPDGERQFLCRIRPSVLTLFLRGFAPPVVRKLFAKRLAHYEMRDRPPSGVTRDIPIVSGCFMLGRRSVLATIGGFHPGYFLYFEDYDLSLELGKHADIAYVDTVRIVHWGGGVPTKGMKHVRLYLRSALLFFNRQGWRLW